MRTRGEFRVEVTKDYLVFASAHFITFAGHRCEPLHGHNYRVGVVLEGATDQENWYVYDFVELKKIMRRLCDEIDHKVLIAVDNPRLVAAERDDAVTVSWEGKVRYVFPKTDCALLAIPNTTVEMLAQYLTGRVRSELATAGGTAHLTAIQVEVEESVGQSAVYREVLD